MKPARNDVAYILDQRVVIQRSEKVLNKMVCPSLDIAMHLSAQVVIEASFKGQRDEDK